MKRYLLALLFFIPLVVFAAEEPRSIQVSGEGSIEAVPDQVKLQFGIETSDKSLVKAKDDNTTKTKQLMDALKKFNIPSKDIQTSYIQINPRYDYANGRQTLTGYTATKSLSITLRDLNDYGKVLNAAVEAGVNQVNGLQFENSKADELKMEAKKRAVANAKAKAEALAAQLNQKVGQPLFIQEGEMASPMPMYRNAWKADAMSLRAASPEDTVSPGETTIRASVIVRFQLQ